MFWFYLKFTLQENGSQLCSALSARAGHSGPGCSNHEYNDELHSACETLGGIQPVWFQI